MPKSPNKPSPSKLRDAFVADLTSLWAYVNRRFAGDQPYALALYGTEGATAELYPQVLTEAGLVKVAQRYVDNKIYETMDEAMKRLRYSVADSPWFRNFENRLPTVKALCAPFADQMYEDDGYKLLAKAAVDAFKLLDERGLFGRGAQREKILLVVIVLDTVVDYSLKTAKAANPPVVFERYKKHNDPEGPFQRIDRIAIASDGRMLFASRSRENLKARPGSPNEFIFEFVAYDVEGAILKERWVFDLTPHNASGRVVRCDPDGRSIVCLAARYDQEARRHLLFRLDTRTGDLLHQFTGDGEVVSLALSPDGQHAAVGTYGTLLLYDAAFQLRHNIETKIGNSGLLFLRTTGELLVGGRRSLIILDPATGQTKDTLDQPGYRLSATADETVLASQWFDPVKKNDFLAVGLVSLPDCKVIREIRLPEKKLVLGALSPDGRHLAAHAYPIEGHRGRAVVIDCQTGQPVLDQKLDHSATAFFPDNRRVAFAITHFSLRPPVNIVELGE